MSLLTIGEVRAVIDTGLSDADLQDAIDREEAALANEIGPLTGPRTVTVTPIDFDAPLWLDRPATAVTVTDNGAATPATVVGGYTVVRTSGTWYGPVVITYTPTDELVVKRVLLGLLKLTLDDVQRGALEYEQIGSYSYRVSNSSRLYESRQTLIDSLKPRRPDLISVPVRSTSWLRPTNP